MQRIEEFLTQAVINAGNELWSTEPDKNLIQIQKTRKDFQGDITLVVFPMLKISKKSPEQTAELLGAFLLNNLDEVESYNVIKGFLNLKISGTYWLEIIREALAEDNYGIKKADKDAHTVMVEYSSPNTNKPLHLGHIRNNLLGFAVSKILEADGKHVVKVNLVNDRGIHICKSMVAWERFGKGETPETSGKKGDKLVGDYYVRFDQEYKKEIEYLKAKGANQKEAEAKAPLMEEARAMLRKWEADDETVTALWEKMNGWVYKGFDETYRNLGVSFDKIYYESQTYKLGRDLVIEGLK
ncbi:MAG TPA: arginine--tRNA ligase, partial [Bacteroidales bacterium]|nr:arginine--tRNA ligase [Bacteroidales bacterium]